MAAGGGGGRLGPVLADIVEVTSSGAKRLKVNGHLFRRSKESGGSQYWSCLERDCGMTAVTRDGEVTLLGGVPARGHTHLPASPYQQLVETLTTNLLRRVRTDLKTPMPAVYQQEVDAVMKAVSAAIPSYEMVRSRLYRARQAVSNAKRGSDPIPAGADDGGDSAVACDEADGDGAVASDQNDCDGDVACSDIDEGEKDQARAATSKSNPVETIEVIEVTVEPEDAAGSGDEPDRSDAHSNADGEADSDAGSESTSSVPASETRPSETAKRPSQTAKRPSQTAKRKDGTVQTSALPPVTFDTSSHGKPVMLVEQYHFRRWSVMSKRSPPVEYWKCAAEKCKSTAVTRGRQLTRLKQRHEHEPPTAARRRAAYLATLRRLVRLEENATTTIPVIYEQERERAGRPEDFPAFSSVRSVLYRERQLERQAEAPRLVFGHVPPVPASASSVESAPVRVVAPAAVAGAVAAGQHQSAMQPSANWTWTGYDQPTTLWVAGPR